MVQVTSKLYHRWACSYKLQTVIYLQNNEFRSTYWKILIYLGTEYFACFFEWNACIFSCRDSHVPALVTTICRFKFSRAKTSLSAHTQLKEKLSGWINWGRPAFVNTHLETLSHWKIAKSYLAHIFAYELTTICLKLLWHA